MQAPAERKTRPCGSQPALTTAFLTGTTLIYWKASRACLVSDCARGASAGVAAGCRRPSGMGFARRND